MTTDSAGRFIEHILHAWGISYYLIETDGDADRISLAKSAGYAKVFTIENLEDMTNGIDEALAAEGPVFVQLLVKPEIENTPVAFRTRTSRTVQIAIKELPEILGINR